MGNWSWQRQRNGSAPSLNTTQMWWDVCARMHGPPDVVMDPLHTFGQPAIRNVRTSSLAEDFRAGCSSQELAELYDLTPDLVD